MRFPLSPKGNMQAFTLLEAVAVIAIVVILSVLVVTMGGNTTIRTARAKAAHEVGTMAAACDAYKTDHGGYPQDNPSGGPSVTNDLDPRIAVNPTDAAYQHSSLFLYIQLTGDTNANGIIDAGETDPRYCTGFFRLSNFDREYRMTGVVAYLSDPFGNSYGYSTAGLKAEQDFKAQQETQPERAARCEQGLQPDLRPLVDRRRHWESRPHRYRPDEVDQELVGDVRQPGAQKALWALCACGEVGRGVSQPRDPCVRSSATDS